MQPTLRVLHDSVDSRADALEASEAFRIQVQNKRFVVPANAELIVEHEIASGREELSFELQWLHASD